MARRRLASGIVLLLSLGSDPITDLPAASFPDERTHSGNTPTELLDYLLDEVDADTRFDALAIALDTGGETLFDCASTRSTSRYGVCSTTIATRSSVGRATSKPPTASSPTMNQVLRRIDL